MKDIHINKKAFHDFEILKKYEAGIVLTGNEIKSIRNASVNLKGSFARFVKGELFLFGMFIAKYEHSNNFYKLDERKNRKLLLKRKELNKLEKDIELNGLSIVPLRVYINDGNKCKIEIALAKGRKNYDKREKMKKDSQKRDIEINHKQSF
jgi:SsrA-binding protein